MTTGMKVAVSIPDEVFAEAEELASELQTSRSELYARAIAEYVGTHAPERVTAAMDSAVEAVGGKAEPFVDAAARQVLSQTEW